MIIVSQDKKRIINFNRIDYIDINIGNGIYYLGVNFSNSYESFFSIGSYKTEERAKEVLREIVRKTEDIRLVNLMENLEIAIHNQDFGISLSNTYYMPED